MSQDDDRKKRIARIIIAYPFALIAISLTLNLLLFDVQSAAISVPSRMTMLSLSVAVVLLIANHIWLMTATELTRLHYNLHATPEEWAQSGRTEEYASGEGLRELARHHNAHRNTTENLIYFVAAGFVFSLISPSEWAAVVWIFGFIFGRLGHTYAFLYGKSDIRGVFMSLSLMSLFGMICYTIISLIM